MSVVVRVIVVGGRRSMVLRSLGGSRASTWERNCWFEGSKPKTLRSTLCVESCGHYVMTEGHFEFKLMGTLEVTSHSVSNSTLEHVT